MAEAEALFEAYPKTARLFRDMIITEKIDGTNAAVVIERHGFGEHADMSPVPWNVVTVGGEGEDECGLPLYEYTVYAQSRNRMIPDNADNAGFRAWVKEHRHALVLALGAGRHFGEWWGQGIQRGYGLDHKRFSLFKREYDERLDTVPGLTIVPVLKRHTFDTSVIRQTLDDLIESGSQAAPGFMNPEGIIVFHTTLRSVAKVTVESDHLPKGLVAA